MPPPMAELLDGLLLAAEMARRFPLLLVAAVLDEAVAFAGTSLLPLQWTFDRVAHGAAREAAATSHLQLAAQAPARPLETAVAATSPAHQPVRPRQLFATPCSRSSFWNSKLMECGSKKHP